MARRNKFDIDPVDVDVDGICASQTPAGAGNLTIAGALTSGGAFDVVSTAGYSAGIAGVQIGIASNGNDSGNTFTVTGTDENGNAVSEAITGPNATTVESTTYFQTISQIAISGAGVGSITVGPVDEIITKTIPLNPGSEIAPAVAVVGLSGTCQFDIDETFDDILANGSTSSTIWLTAQSNKNADLAAQLDPGATGVRLKFDSYTNGAELQFYTVVWHES